MLSTAQPTLWNKNPQKVVTMSQYDVAAAVPVDQPAPKMIVLPDSDALVDVSHDAENRTPQEELEQLLAANSTRLGDVYRGLKEGLNSAEIASQLNVDSSNFVSNYKVYIDAILYGKVPARGYLRQAGASARSVLKAGRSELSQPAIELLKSHVASLEKAYESSLGEHPSADDQFVGDQDEELSAVLGRLASTPAIYAFSYGWYLESPVDAERGNTLIKVGQSEHVGQRIREHQSYAVKTHMPEPVAILRIYSLVSHDAKGAERLFHKLLTTAGHDNPRRALVRGKSEVGKEWFLTSPDFLDAAAEACGLKTEYIGGI